MTDDATENQDGRKAKPGLLKRRLAPAAGAVLGAALTFGIFYHYLKNPEARAGAGAAPQGGEQPKPGRFKKRLISLAGLVVALAIMFGIVYYYLQNPGMFRDLRSYGYFGAFVISLVLNATVILPVSNLAIMMTLGATMPFPAAVGIIGAVGAAIGELTGYTAGRSGRGLLSRSHMYLQVEGWMRRWGWIAVFVFSIVPFAFDVVGIAAGALRMPLWRFLVACCVGRMILYVTMVMLASMGFRMLPWVI